MGVPYHGISDVPFPAAFLSPDSADVLPTVSLELGGVALNDASSGRQVQDWRAWIEGGTTIKVAPLPSLTPETTLVSGGVNITTVSLAFDSNMQPTVAYLEDGTLKLRWYDLTVNGFVTTSFPGCSQGRVSSDDKRAGQEGASDVLFSYLRAGSLYWREQRDRYLVERLVGVVPAGFRLVTMGMNALGRMQWRLVSP